MAIGESEGVERKPAPDTVFKALKELGASAKGAVYIGDSDVDIATARNAGLPCISVSWASGMRTFSSPTVPRRLWPTPTGFTLPSPLSPEPRKTKRAEPTEHAGSARFVHYPRSRRDRAPVCSSTALWGHSSWQQ